MHFWQTLKRPIIGLAPMDGVTDAAYRKVFDICSHPDVLFSEFVPVEAIQAGAVKVLESFVAHETETPTIGQIYGSNLDGYRLSTYVVCALGFDGIDINMGCPAKSVAARGAGAGLIRIPDHACQIIRTVKQSVAEWFTGMTIDDIQISSAMKAELHRIKRTRKTDISSIPISVKTRIGYDMPTTREWIGRIAAEQPDALTIHGRTLKQLYSGKASWEEIAIAATTARSIAPNICVLGSGDITSRDHAITNIQTYGLDGALIGRATWGNPWIFTGHTPTKEERLHIALTHAKLYAEMLPNGHFISLRKHMAWYMSGFHNASVLRAQMLRITSVADIERIVEEATEGIGHKIQDAR